MLTRVLSLLGCTTLLAAASPAAAQVGVAVDLRITRPLDARIGYYQYRGYPGVRYHRHPHFRQDFRHRKYWRDRYYGARFYRSRALVDPCWGARVCGSAVIVLPRGSARPYYRNDYRDYRYHDRDYDREDWDDDED